MKEILKITSLQEHLSKIYQMTGLAQFVELQKMNLNLF